MNTPLKELKTFAELISTIHSHKANTLFVFDMDLVVSIPKEPAFHPLNFELYKAKLKPLFTSLNAFEEELVFSLIAALSERQLVEKCFSHLVQEIFGNGHKAIALTAQLAFSWEDINLIEQRIKEVHTFSLNFNQSFSHVSPFHFQEWTTILGAVPVFKEGVIFSHTEKNSKGEVLKAFLEKIDYFPESIVFVDDRENNVISVRKAMGSLGIPCQGWHYKGVFECEIPFVEETTFVMKWQEKVEQAVDIAKNRLYLKS